MLLLVMLLFVDSIIIGIGIGIGIGSRNCPILGGGK
jgi:hypothetical protein